MNQSSVLSNQVAVGIWERVAERKEDRGQTREVHVLLPLALVL